MEKFVIIKSVEAEHNEETGKYKVVNTDGYTTECPFDVFNETAFNVKENELAASALDMVSANFKDRFRAEYTQLDIRCQRLQVMLQNWRDGKLQFMPKCNYGILDMQLQHMMAYKSILEARAKIEGIEL